MRQCRRRHRNSRMKNRRVFIYVVVIFVLRVFGRGRCKKRVKCKFRVYRRGIQTMRRIRRTDIYLRVNVGVNRGVQLDKMSKIDTSIRTDTTLEKLGRIGISFETEGDWGSGIDGSEEVRVFDKE